MDGVGRNRAGVLLGSGDFFDAKKFLLLSRGFNWIQERPFNR